MQATTLRRRIALLAAVSTVGTLLVVGTAQAIPDIGDQPTSEMQVWSSEDKGTQGPLEPGEALWWEGEFEVDQDSVQWPAPPQQQPPVEICGVAIDCHDYKLQVKGPIRAGSRLRVALTNWEGHFTFDALDLAVYPPPPSGGECRPTHYLTATHGAQVSTHYAWSLEAFLHVGAPGACGAEVVEGTYTVRVFAAQRSGGTEPAPYDLRAALEEPGNAESDVRLLPDLAPESPPFGFAFGCQPENGDPWADSPPNETGSGELARERVCLRYAFTYGNVGDGMLDLYFDPRTIGTEAPITQRIYQADASPGRYEADQRYDEWRAGTAHFHESHRHWHVSGFYDAELLRVLKSGSGLDLDHPGRAAVKQGVCTSPWFMVDFDRVFQDDSAVPSTGCDLNELGRPELEEIRIPLPAGWGDIYDRIQPDNFVDVTGELRDALPEDGVEYVLRFTINPKATRELGKGRSPLTGGGYIAESDISNNTAYAHIRITSREPAIGDPERYAVCIVERGFGDDPWAANAVPVDVDSEKDC